MFKKEEGRKRITAAVAGLLIALSSWLILNQINPEIFKSNLTLAPLSGGGGTGVPLPGGGTPGTPGGNNPPPYSTGGSVDGIPYGGAYNPTLDSAIPGHNGIENLAQIKTDANGNQYVGGTMSTFGGPNDTGVTPTETGAITGENLRGLDPNSLYIAGRWNYSETSRSDLQNRTVTVYNPTTGQSVSGVRIVDWGPNPNTGRTWDVSPGVANSVGVNTNDEVWVRFD